MLLARGAGDPERIAYAVRILRPCPLDEVADAVAAYATSTGGAVYVERVDGQYRWSPATRGGAYPLLRLLARFLGCAHTELTVGVVTVDGWCLAANPDEPRSDQFAILDAPPDSAQRAAAMIAANLGPPRS